MAPHMLSHKEVLARLMNMQVSDDEDEEEDEFGDSITYQACVDEGLSFPNAQAAADWMRAQELRDAASKRAERSARVEAELKARADAEARAEANTATNNAKERVRAKEKEKARKWLAALGEPEKQNRGSKHAHTRTAQSPSSEKSNATTAGSTSGAQSEPASTPSSGPPPPRDSGASLPEGWTYDGMSYRSPIATKPDGGFSYTFSSFPPSVTAEEDHVIPPGEDPDPEACPMCAVMGLSNGRGRCLHTGWRKGEDGVWKGPPSADLDEDESPIKIRVP